LILPELNGLLLPGGTNFLTPMEEMSKEELNVLKRQRGKNVARLQNLSSSMKSITAAMDRFLR